MPIVTVVIPNFNSPVIDRTLRALHEQDYDRTKFEVIVVGLDDPQLVLADALVFFDKTERRYNPAEARNRGAAQANGEIIAFLDSDCVPPSNWLSEITHCFLRQEISGVGGGVRFSQKNYWMFADNLAMFHEFLYTRHAELRSQFPSLNFAIRKSDFLEENGFDTHYPLPAGEDFDFTYRLSRKGKKLWFEPAAWIWHCPTRNSLRDLWNHGYLMGQFSTKIDPRYQGTLGFPAWLVGRTRLILLSPVLAFGASLRIFRGVPAGWKYMLLFPAVFVSKLAWCLGAANSPLLHKARG